MATHIFSASLFKKRCTLSIFSRSYVSISVKSPSSSLLSPSSVSHLRPIYVGAINFTRRWSPVLSTFRCFTTRKATSSQPDELPADWYTSVPKMIPLDGCDFEHWLVVLKKLEGERSRDELIDLYVKTLATVVGVGEKEARMKIYYVSTRHYYAFGALISEELSYKLRDLDKVRWVLPDSYLNAKNKDYGGEPFINGQYVPYDPKYHDEWVRNDTIQRERVKQNLQDLRSDNMGEGLQNLDERSPDIGVPQYMGEESSNPGGSQNMGGGPQNMEQMPQNNIRGMSQGNMGGMLQSNMGEVLQINLGGALNIGTPSNYMMGGRVPPITGSENFPPRKMHKNESFPHHSMSGPTSQDQNNYPTKSLY